MAKPVRRGKKWHIQIKLGNSRPSGTFDTKAQAETWAAVQRAEYNSVRSCSIPNKTFGQLLERYSLEVSPKHKGERWEKLRINRLLAEPICAVKLSKLSANHVTDWRDRRIQEVSAASVRREWTLMSHAATIGIKEWNWLRDNPFRTVSRPPPPRPRQRVFSQTEIQDLSVVFGTNPATVMGRVGLAFAFALETAMRAGEITSLTWANVHERYVHLPNTKNGSARDVPLSGKADAILRELRAMGGSETVFRLDSSSLDANFRKSKKLANISGVTFHDARRTALTRLSSKFTLMELSRISGIRDIRMLQNVYYAPDVNELADKMD